MREELSKAEFKKRYMHYRTEGDGWSDNYWEQFYEHQTARKYFFTEPKTTEHTRMFISDSAASVHIFFMTEDAEDSLFDYPGKE